MTRETFAERLNRLFERERARGRALTNEDIERLTDGAVSANHVWKLRHNRRANPTLETLQALARVFGVGLDYFGGGEPAENQDEVAIRRALAQPEVRHIVARMGTRIVTPRDAARMARILDVLLDDANGKETGPDEQTDPAGPAPP